jgi:hypothetical protein
MAGLLMVVVGCGTATSVAPVGGDAGEAGVVQDVGPADAGASLEDRQFQAAAALESEMSAGVREMGTYPAASTPPFMAALAAWNAAIEHERMTYRTDAAAQDQRARAIEIRVTERLPAYCQMRAAMPELTPMVVPRIRCNELPVTGPWWERYETR